MSSLSQVLKQRFFTANGSPLVGALLYTYQAGTAIPLATYVDQPGQTPNTNPVKFNSNGEADVWIGSGAYKFVLTDSSGTVILTRDNVSYINPLTITTAHLANGCVTSTNYADQAVATAKIGNANVTQSKLAPNSVNVTTLQTSTPMNRDYGETLSPKFAWTTTPSVGFPVVQPTTTASLNCAWSPDSRFLSVLHLSTPFFINYERVGSTFIRCDDPGSLPAGNSTGIAWSPSNEFLAVGNTTTVNLFQRQGVSAFAKMADPATVATGASSVAWSPDGEFLIVCTSASPFVYVYQRSGATLNYQSGALVAPTGSSSGVAFSADGTLMAIGFSVTPFVALYQRSGGTFVRLNSPATLPPLASTKGLAFSPDGQFLAIAHATTPFISLYQISGTTFIKLSNPASLPTSNAFNLCFSPDSKYLVVGTQSTPCLFIYSISGTTFTLIANPSTVPVANCGGVSFSPDGQFLAIAQGSAPRVIIYKTDQALTLGLTYAGSVFDV